MQNQSGAPHRAKWLPPFQELSRCRKSLAGARQKDERKTGRRRKREEKEEGRKASRARRQTTTTTTVTAAAAAVDAVGRKFKIEYLASNFHRSSKNRAVSYLAGGHTLGCSPPLFFSSFTSFLFHPPQREPRKDGGKRNSESSPLHTVATVLRDRLCSDMETHGNARTHTRIHTYTHARYTRVIDTYVLAYVCEAARRRRGRRKPPHERIQRR